MANIEATVSVEIDAAPEAVFGVLTDPSRMAEWVNGVQSGEWSGGSAASPGGRFKLHYRYARRSHDIAMQVDAVEQDSLFEFHTIEGPYPIKARFTLRPTGNGTHVSYYQDALSDSKLAALGFMLTGWIAKPMIRRTLRKDLVKLAAAVTGEQEDASPA